MLEFTSMEGTRLPKTHTSDTILTDCETYFYSADTICFSISPFYLS